jgi:hypothetical protein
MFDFSEFADENNQINSRQIKIRARLSFQNKIGIKKISELIPRLPDPGEADWENDKCKICKRLVIRAKHGQFL